MTSLLHLPSGALHPQVLCSKHNMPLRVCSNYVVHIEYQILHFTHQSTVIMYTISRMKSNHCQCTVKSLDHPNCVVTPMAIKHTLTTIVHSMITINTFHTPLMALCHVGITRLACNTDCTCPSQCTCMCGSHSSKQTSTYAPSVLL